MFDYEGWGITSGEQEFGEVSGEDVEVIWLAASSLPRMAKDLDGVFSVYGVTAGEMEVLLEVDGFDMDGDGCD